MFRTSRALPTDAGQAAETEMDVVGVLGANHDDWLLHAVSARAMHTRTAMPPRLRDMRQVYEPGGVWWEKLRLRRPRLVLRAMAARARFLGAPIAAPQRVITPVTDVTKVMEKTPVLSPK